MNLKDKKILVTGGAGFLGSFVIEKLLEQGARKENITICRSAKHDLTKREACREVVRGQDIVLHLAAKVGGIGFNRDNPATLFHDNIIMGVQLLDEAQKAGVEKFVSVGTVCAYPKLTPVPFREDDLWIGYPEETNAPYGLAKKMLLVQGQAYRAQHNLNAVYLLPVNLYGPRDNFDPVSSHVIPALIKKFYEAKIEGRKEVQIWGTGKATREFLYVEDAAEGIVSAMERYSKPDPVNLGSGQEISIKNLVNLIASLMDFRGEVVWDYTKPDGQPRRMLETSKAEKEFGFKAETPFKIGLAKTIKWFINHEAS